MTITDRVARRAYAPLSTPARLAATIAAGVAVDVAFDPAHRHVPLCPFRATTGGWCPFCGGLRAVDALAHGHLGAALRDNLLVVAALPVLLALWLDWARRSRDGRPARRAGRTTWIAVIAVLVVFTVARNLPFASALHP